MSTTQTDWDNREVTEMIQVQILKMTEFLNRFHLSTRNRLSIINERLCSIERGLSNVESAANVKTTPKPQ